MEKSRTGISVELRRAAHSEDNGKPPAGPNLYQQEIGAAIVVVGAGSMKLEIHFVIHPAAYKCGDFCSETLC